MTAEAHASSVPHSASVYVREHWCFPRVEWPGAPPTSRVIIVDIGCARSMADHSNGSSTSEFQAMQDVLRGSFFRVAERGRAGPREVLSIQVPQDLAGGQRDTLHLLATADGEMPASQTGVAVA